MLGKHPPQGRALWKGFSGPKSQGKNSKERKTGGMRNSEFCVLWFAISVILSREMKAAFRW
jgi:hypothetical protein